MIVTVVKVTDFDRFLDVFATTGVQKRQEHGCRGSQVYVDPEDPLRVWAIFDWDEEDYNRFLEDPEIPAIAQSLRLQEPPVLAIPTAEYDA
jgi:quinol monooxygenase YgiN